MNLTVNVIEYIGTGLQPEDLDVAIGGISINGDSNVASSNTLTVEVVDGSTAEVIVTETGYHTYSMVIDNVYSEDKIIYIMLVDEITDIMDDDYNRPNPYHFFFQDPCSFKIDFYNASSFPGEISWYINNELHVSNQLKDSFELCSPQEVQLKVRSVTYDVNTQEIMWDRQWANTDNVAYVNPGQQVGEGETGNVTPLVVQDLSTYLDLDLQTNITEVEFRPDFSFSVSSPSDQVEDYCCYTRDEYVTIESSVTSNRAGSTLVDYLLSYEVIAPNGLTVLSETMSAFVADSNVEFQLKELGEYEIIVTLTDVFCGLTYIKSKKIETCNFITLDTDECGKFKIENHSTSLTANIVIEDLEGNIVESENNLPPLSGLTQEFSYPSMYIYTVTYEKNGEQYIEKYPVNNYCIIKDCLSKYILDILCGDVDRCKPCPEPIEVNRFLLLYNTYSMKLHKLYGENNFYSLLTKSDLEEMTEINQIMDKILQFCEQNNCVKSYPVTTSSTKYDLPSSNCGCK